MSRKYPVDYMKGPRGITKVTHFPNRSRILKPNITMLNRSRKQCPIPESSQRFTGQEFRRGKVVRNAPTRAKIVLPEHASGTKTPMNKSKFTHEGKLLTHE